MIRYRKLAMVAAIFALSGCGGSGHSDLNVYIQQTLAKPAGEIEPVPTFRPYRGYRYSTAALRSPFEPPQVVTAQDSDFGRVAVAPDTSRPREMLENFNFAGLSMVGTLERDGVVWALIDDGRGSIHRVTTGNYLGKNHGKIVNMTKSQLDVIEIVPDGKNGWVERPRTLALKEN
jgi:type IV pilus assembly protein PilP